MLNFIMLANAILIVCALIFAWLTYYKVAWFVMAVGVALLVYGYSKRDK
jgi:hypothetical protein